MVNINDFINSKLNEAKVSDDPIVMGDMICDKIFNKKKLTKSDLKWMEENVAVYPIYKKWDIQKLIKNTKGKKDYYELNLNWMDVSNLESLSSVFSISRFNGDISKWDVSNCKDFTSMFGSNAYFNGDISGWDMSSAEDTSYMFDYAESFNQNISKWKINPKCNTEKMFNECPIKDNFKPRGVK
jgi:hypothetical protein